MSRYMAAQLRHPGVVPLHDIVLPCKGNSLPFTGRHICFVYIINFWINSFIHLLQFGGLPHSSNNKAERHHQKKVKCRISFLGNVSEVNEHYCWQYQSVEFSAITIPGSTSFFFFFSNIKINQSISQKWSK